MDATATLSNWKKTFWHTLSFVALFWCAYRLPPLAFLLTAVLPLFLCPAFAQGGVWVALALALTPTAGYLLGGGDAVFGAALALFPCLCLFVAYGKLRWHWRFTTGTAGYVAAFLAASLLVIFRAGELLGGPLFPRLSDTTVQWVSASPYAGNILYRLTSLGFLDVPDSYRTAAMFQVGSLIWINPPLQQELMNMLRLRLNEGFAQWIPTLLMQGGVGVGLFTALTTERARARLTPNGQGMPSFRMLRLSGREQGYVMLLCVATALTSFSDQPFVALLCLLMYAALAAVFQLLGASVMVYALSRRHPERLWLYGCLAAALYLLFPLALFLLGVMDQFLNLRQSGFHFTQSDQ